MGIWDNVRSRVRSLLRGDKEQVALQLARLTRGPSYGRGSWDYLGSIGHDLLAEHLRLDHDLLMRYADYEEMDDIGELSSAIDIYADDATQTAWENGRSIWVESPDARIREILDVDLLQKQLRIEEEIWEICRSLCKHGDDHEQALVTADGVVGLNFLPPATMRRIEGRRGELHGFIQDFRGGMHWKPEDFHRLLEKRNQNPAAAEDGSDPIAYEDWEVAHFRLRSKRRRALYGFSVLEPARYIWKRLVLLEDAAMIFRLQRAPERYAFYIDMGDTPPQEWPAKLSEYRAMYKKKKWYNATTGAIDRKFNPMAQDEDFYAPMADGKKTSEIEVLGSPSWQEVNDLEYFRDKLFAAIKVPRAYLNIGEGTNRAALSHVDARFARTILRVQRALRDGMSKVCRVHLAAIGIDPSAVDFTVVTPVPSAIFELAQLEVQNARADLAARTSGHFSLHWILSTIYRLSDDEIALIMRQRKKEAEAGLLPEPPDGRSQPLPPEARDGVAGDDPEGRSDAGGKPRERAQEWRGRSTRGRRDLFEGNRDDERRAEDELADVLEREPALAQRLNELADFVDELRSGGRG